MIAIACCVEISSGVNHACHAENDKHQYRYYKVYDRTVGSCRLFVVLLGTNTMLYDMQLGVNHFVYLSASALVPFLQACVVLAHSLEVETRHYNHKHEDNGEECVEIKRYCLAEQG